MWETLIIMGAQFGIRTLNRHLDKKRFKQEKKGGVALQESEEDALVREAFEKVKKYKEAQLLKKKEAKLDS